MVASHIDSVKIIRNSAPYINAHRGKTFVLMFGGEAIEKANFANIIHDIALLSSLGVRLVLVHGARPQIDQRVALRNLPPRFHQGIRITDKQTLECVKDAAGSVRARFLNFPGHFLHRPDGTLRVLTLGRVVASTLKLEAKRR